MILFITNKQDITTDIIINKLNQRDTPYFRLNTEDIFAHTQVSFDFSDNIYHLLDTEGNVLLDLDDVDSVYYRRPELPGVVLDNLLSEEKHFVLNEAFYSLEGLYKLLSDRYWLNSVFSIREAENKIYQLTLAKNIGFDIPESIITSNEKDAREFILSHNNDCILKPIKSGQVGESEDSQIIFTNALDEKHIKELNRINGYPTYFQECLHKKSDIRVTVVGEQIFAAKIHSQDFDDTKVDWRKGESVKLSYSEYTLPKEVKKKCYVLLEILHLNFGAIDFVETTDDRLVFLEINPNGQWGWIEKRLGLQISDEIIRLLNEAHYVKIK